MADALEAKITALSEAQARERRFTADVAHELRTPLTAIVNEASLLAEHLDRMPPEARRPAELLVEDVKRLARPRRGPDGDLPARRGHAAGATGAGRPRLARRAAVHARGWQERVRVEADEVVLDDRSAAGRAHRRQPDRQRARARWPRRHRASRRGRLGAFVEVADRGRGIAREDLPHLFERFYKADTARTRRGTGLGLAIALENARLLGGDIEVWSEAGVGARFTLRLPVTEPLRGGEEPVAGDRHA